MSNIFNINFQSVEVPKIEVQKKDGYGYLKWGIENDYPQTILELSVKSKTHQACLKLIQQAINGKGFRGNQSFLDFIALQDAKCNSSTLLEKIAFDLAIFEAFALKVIWNKGGKIHSIYHIPLQYVRCGVTNDYNQVEQFYVSKDWKKYRPEISILPNFEPELVLNDDGSVNSKFASQIYYYSKEHPLTAPYNVPSYHATIDYINIEHEIGIFHHSNLKNGCLPSMMITIPSELDSEKREQIKKEWKDEFQGSENAGRFIMLFSDNPERSVKIDTLSNVNNNDMFISLSSEAFQSIISAHGLTSPSLAGLTNNSGFNNSGDELLTAYKTWENTKIASIHESIIKAFQEILKNSDIDTSDISIEKFNPLPVDEPTQTLEPKNNEL